MAPIDNVVSLHRKLLDEWNKPGTNIKNCGPLLNQLKVSKSYK